MNVLEYAARALKNYREMTPEQLLEEAAFRAQRQDITLDTLQEQLRAAYANAVECARVAHVYCELANANNCNLHPLPPLNEPNKAS